MNSFDVIVVGAGHNSLSAAAYLAKAGMSVLVLERNPWCGGGVVTRELNAPGFKYDVHSTGHIYIQANPMIANDELGLQAKYGLRYIRPESTFGSIFKDGSTIQSRHDLDSTCESIAKFSERDADRYRDFAKLCDQLLPMFTLGLFSPPTPFGALMALLEQSQIGRDMIGSMQRSSYDMVMTMFENEQVQMHMLKYASEIMVGPEEKGTGIALFLMSGFSHRYHTGLPEGGSGALTDSLVRCIEDHGGTVMTDCSVKQILTSGGEARGVRLADGREFAARRSVVASVHPYLLNAMVGGSLEPDLVRRIDEIRPSAFSAMNSHYALNEAPAYKCGGDFGQTFVIECQPDSLQELREGFDSMRYGRLPEHGAAMAANTTLFDPTRAPAGKHTLYLYHFMPYDLEQGGAERWDEIKEQTADWLLGSYRDYTTNMTSQNIIARTVDSPLDIERNTASMQKGDILGTGMFINQFLGRRPIPELANYRVPGIGKLYLSGPFMHPGGGVMGGGRATAQKIFMDMGIPFDSVIG